MCIRDSYHIPSSNSIFNSAVVPFKAGYAGEMCIRDRLDTVDGVYGYVKSAAGARELTPISVFGDKVATGHLYFELSKAAEQDLSLIHSTSYVGLLRCVRGFCRCT